MRLRTDRIVATAALTAAIALLAGCNNKPKNSGTSTPTGESSGGVASSGATPRQSADAFLASLKDGKATPDQLTPTFRSAIAPPTNDDDKKVGYSVSDARDWLARFQNTNFVVGDETKFGDAIVLRGRAESPNRREAFSLRMVKDTSAFKVDWLHRSERIGMEIKNPSDADLSAAQDTVRNFLDVLLGGDLRQAHALMTPAFKKSVAPPTAADIRKGLEYDPGFLTQTTRSWKGDFVGYTLPKAELSGNKLGATFMAELDSGSAKSSYAIQAVRDKTTGRWLIEKFNKQ